MSVEAPPKFVEAPPKFAPALSPLETSLRQLLRISYFKEKADLVVAEKMLREARIYTVSELEKNQTLHQKGDWCVLRYLRNHKYDTMFHEHAYRVADRMLQRNHASEK
ncbi:hypothetical protein HK104_004578 [Borealophlyctis nickersoniae]|nr:hypothetical protein HK104_004578 [Borealophlyctis nickersoniae]